MFEVTSNFFIVLNGEFSPIRIKLAIVFSLQLKLMSLVFTGIYCELLQSPSYVNYIEIRLHEENINKHILSNKSSLMVWYKVWS